MKACRVIYASFFVLCCIYVIFIRLQAIPISISYALYGLSIVSASAALLSSGVAKGGNKQDLTVIILFFLYYFVSGLLYVAFEESAPSWILKDYIYSLLPLYFYIIVRLSKIELNVQILLLLAIIAITLIDILSIMMYFNVGFNLTSYFRQDSLDYEGTISFALSGVLGVIFTGFTNVIGIIICVFSPVRLHKITKIILCILYVTCIFLTGQRTPIGGLVIIMLIFLLQKKGKGLAIIAVIAGLLAISIPYVNIEVEGISVEDVLVERTFSRFQNIKAGDTGRNDQYKVYNDGVAEYLLGQGVGTHSPDNPQCTTPMPDAMLYRIFNEMGLLGLSLFLLFFYLNLMRAIRRRNWFIIALLAYMFLSNATNRVLFYAPFSILPYFLLAYFNWHITKHDETKKIVGNVA
jgi:hypothetical protein